MGVLSPPDHTTEVSPRPTTIHSPLLRREMPGLDALRGIAVLAVVAYHGLHWWLPPAISISRGVQIVSSLVAPGWLGVNLFFVLSGFLITGILVDTRHRPDYWWNFYTRRALRILPLYLVVLLILQFYFRVDWRYLLLCVFYLANFADRLPGEHYGPLWSLAVEEQFYLVWPLLVRRLHLRTLGILCIGSIVLSPLLRYVCTSKILPLGDPYTATWLLTDTLAAGALIAILLRSPGATPARVRAFTVGAGLVGIAMLALEFRLRLLSRATALGAALQPEPFLFLFAAMLLLALQYGSHPVIFRITGPLRFFGYISYGLYLFHLLGFKAYQDLFVDFYHVPAVLTLGAVLLRFGGVVGVTTLVCFGSRRYFEEYFLRQKDRLAPYGRSRGSVSN
jgi:peptidoglycan/LPS O-acetylase OafA/YrhL